MRLTGRMLVVAIIRLRRQVNRARAKVHDKGHNAGHKEKDQTQRIQSYNLPVDVATVRLADAFGVLNERRR